MGVISMRAQARGGARAELGPSLGERRRNRTAHSVAGKTLAA